MGFTEQGQEHNSRYFRNAGGSMNRQQIGPTLKEIDSLQKSLDNSGRVCKIPALLGEPPETNRMRRGHIIGEKFLERIWDKREVYAWPYSIKHMGHSAVAEMDSDNFTLPPLGQKINSNECTIKFACHKHDNEVFKLIDTGNINLTDTKVQFLLGFRAIASFATWIEGHVRLASDTLPDRPRTQEILQKYPQSNTLLLDAQTTITNPKFKQHTEKIFEELVEWQALYENQQGEYPIITCHQTATPNIRTAGAGVIEIELGYTLIVTILPRAQTGGEKPLCDIIVTSRKPKLWSEKAYLQLRARATTTKIAKLLESEAIKAIPPFATASPFFYFSPKDYETLTSAEQKQEIDDKIAPIIKEMNKHLS